jgi:hypothetical protein
MRRFARALGLKSPEIWSNSSGITGAIVLSGGTASYTLQGAYTSAPNCVAQDVTTPSKAASVSESTTTLPFTGTGSDTVKWVLWGETSFLWASHDSGQQSKAFFFFNFFAGSISDKWAFAPLVVSGFRWPLKHVGSEFYKPEPQEILLNLQPKRTF